MQPPPPSPSVFLASTATIQEGTARETMRTNFFRRHTISLDASPITNNQNETPTEMEVDDVLVSDMNITHENQFDLSLPIFQTVPTAESLEVYRSDIDKRIRRMILLRNFLIKNMPPTTDELKVHPHFLELWRLRCLDAPDNINMATLCPGFVNALFHTTQTMYDSFNTTRAIPNPFVDLAMELASVSGRLYEINFIAENGVPSFKVDVTGSKLGEHVSCGLYRCLKSGAGRPGIKCVLRCVGLKYVQDSYYRIFPIAPHDCNLRVY